MILWWIGDIVLLLVVVPIVVYLLRGVLNVARSIVPSVEAIATVAANTAFIPQLEATAPVLSLIVTEAVVQDGYMNALTDGYGGA